MDPAGVLGVKHGLPLMRAPAFRHDAASRPRPPSTPVAARHPGALLQRIADALERLAPAAAAEAGLRGADAFVWHAAGRRLSPGAQGQPGRDEPAAGHRPGARHPVGEHRRASPAACRPTTPCSGARAAWASPRSSRPCTRRSTDLRAAAPGPLKLIEIHREDIETLPDLMGLLRADPHRFIVFCDDLSFDADDTSYKSLKAVLEGGIEGRPENVIFYATSNRRHLLPRDMMENERSTAINPGEAVEEKVSLSDRFGLWLGFHKCSQDEYLDMVFGYVDHFGLDGRPRRHPRPRRWNGRRRAARARAAPPGSSSRIWRAGRARRSDRPAHCHARACTRTHVHAPSKSGAGQVRPCRRIRTEGDGG